MQIRRQIQKSFPAVCAVLSETGASVSDLSRNSVSITGTVSPMAPLTSGSKFAHYAASSSTLTMQNTWTDFKRHTLECWVAPGSGAVSLLSHETVNDGLRQVSGQIQYIVDLSVTGRVTLKYTPRNTERRLHIVGVCDGRSLQLFVNSVLVDAVDLANGEVAVNTAANSNFVTGAGAGNAVVEFPAYYAHPMPLNDIQDHYLAGLETPDIFDVAMTSGVKLYDGTSEPNNVLRVVPNPGFEGHHVNTIYSNGALVPALDATGQTIAGSWTYTLHPQILSGQTAVSAALAVSLKSNASVSYAVGAGAPVTVTSPVTVISTSITSTTPVTITVSFPGGETDSTSAVFSIELSLYLGDTLYGFDSSRPVTMGGGYRSKGLEPPLERSPTAIITSPSGGITLEADTTSTPESLYSFVCAATFASFPAICKLFDLRPAGGTAYIQVSTGGVISKSGMNLYVNGSLISTTFTAVPGQMYIIGGTVTAGSALYAKINSGGNCSLQFFGISTTDIQTAGHLKFYKRLSAIDSIASGANDTLTLSQPVDHVESIDTEWTILAAGG